MPEPIIELDDLCTRFGDHVVHQDLFLRVMRGEILSLVGGSGSGKTVLLRQILGLERPSSGTIKLFGEPLAQLSPRELAALRTRTGVLFQKGALFSALSVLDNIAFPIRERRMFPADAVNDMAMLKIEMVGLEREHASRMPAQLSGGMIKRAALARALALDPDVLFLDEPTAGLDPQSSDDFVALLRQLHRELHLTVVMVTHDLDTLIAVSDRIAVLADRKIIVAAPLSEVVAFEHPFIRQYFQGERGQRALSALSALEPAGS